MRSVSPEWYLAGRLAGEDRRIWVFLSCPDCSHLFVGRGKLVLGPQSFYLVTKERGLSLDTPLTESDLCPLCGGQMSRCRLATAADLLAAGYERSDYE